MLFQISKYKLDPIYLFDINHGLQILYKDFTLL